MRYDYGPVRLSLWRGVWLTILVPLTACCLLGASNFALFDAPSIGYALRDAANEVGSWYRTYPVPVLIVHIVFFLKGLAYRRRYASVGPQLFLLGIAAAIAWILAPTFGVSPAQTLADLSVMPSVQAASPRPAVAHPQGTPKPALTLNNPVPNRLDQSQSRVQPVIEVKRSGDGSYSASGFLGSLPAVFAVNLEASVSAASTTLIPAARGPCLPGTAVLDGETVPGCLSLVEESYIGPIPVRGLVFFFTDVLPPGHAVIGLKAATGLRSTINASGAVVLRPQAP